MGAPSTLNWWSVGPKDRGEDAPICHQLGRHLTWLSPSAGPSLTQAGLERLTRPPLLVWLVGPSDEMTETNPLPSRVRHLVWRPQPSWHPFESRPIEGTDIEKGPGSTVVRSLNLWRAFQLTEGYLCWGVLPSSGTRSPCLAYEPAVQEHWFQLTNVFFRFWYILQDVGDKRVEHVIQCDMIRLLQPFPRQRKNEGMVASCHWYSCPASDSICCSKFKPKTIWHAPPLMRRGLQGWVYVCWDSTIQG